MTTQTDRNTEIEHSTTLNNQQGNKPRGDKRCQIKTEKVHAHKAQSLASQRAEAKRERVNEKLGG